MLGSGVAHAVSQVMYMYTYLEEVHMHAHTCCTENNRSYAISTSLLYSSVCLQSAPPPLYYFGPLHQGKLEFYSFSQRSRSETIRFHILIPTSNACNSMYLSPQVNHRSCSPQDTSAVLKIVLGTSLIADQNAGNGGGR